MKRKRDAQHGTGLRLIMHAAPHSDHLSWAVVCRLAFQEFLSIGSQNDDLQHKGQGEDDLEVGTTARFTGSM